MRKHWAGLMLLMCTFVAGCWSVQFGQVYLGRAEAYINIRQGKRQLKRCTGWCVQAEHIRGYEKMLVDTFGAKTLIVELEQCSDERLRGYNETQVAEIDRIYGKGSFKEAGRKYTEEYLRRWNINIKSPGGL